MTANDALMSTTIVQGAAWISLLWSSFVIVVQSIGVYKLFRNNSKPLAQPVSPWLPEGEVPHVTVIRPVKGVEPALYECLASTFRQTYPKTKLSVRLCVATRDDPAYPILQQLVADFPDVDAEVLVEEDDPLLHGSRGHVNNLGPNPKIRNISRAYREAKGDVIWIVDCNVWVAKGAAGRLIDKLFGFCPNGVRAKQYKFVHQLPLVVDMDTPRTEEALSLLSPDDSDRWQARDNTRLADRGGRLEEMFMGTTHAKFYSAINAVGVAPCVVGKSNMFRKSDLDRLTDPAQNPLLSASDASRGRGVDFFSSYICEDHVIGDLIFKSAAPGFLKHGLSFGDVAIQPMSGMTAAGYIARRVRWLRARKWTVLAATLIEPGVESILCCLYFAFALTTIPWFHENLGISQTWGEMAAIWASGMVTWMFIDRCLTSKLHKLQSAEVDEHTPAFARGTSRQGGVQQRSFLEWLAAWLGRELLAMPIWTWAVLLGTTVEWRGKKFRVHPDMSVVEIEDGKNLRPQPSRTSSPQSASKGRVD
ncbi:glycosyltransferase family 21 protein [Cercophora scortea]|uniref:Ceramide glucosyltransferase n=1 Tax=Cercophora scortea TaxID=314031 RepID=A0AAE0MD56_9PEZI|nr:glycosyltransferase family 21 protein [Cercophora scortea]